MSGQNVLLPIILQKRAILFFFNEPIQVLVSLLKHLHLLNLLLYRPIDTVESKIVDIIDEVLHILVQIFDSFRIVRPSQLARFLVLIKRETQVKGCVEIFKVFQLDRVLDWV